MSSSEQSKTLIEQATAAANAIVRRNFSAIGVAASMDGYQQVWARDSMITLLGAALDANPDVLAAFRVTLSTLVNPATAGTTTSTSSSAASGKSPTQ